MAWGVYDYPEPKNDDIGAVCPCCGAPCYYVFRNFDGDVVGCDECLTKEDAVDADECFRYGGVRR